MLTSGEMNSGGIECASGEKHFLAEYDITIIVFDSKLCLLYNRMEIDDEFQYLFNCTYRVVKDSRKIIILKCSQHRPNAVKFHTVMILKSGKKDY